MSLPTPSPEVVLQQLNWRYATKKFDADKKIPADVWALLEQSLVLAPSSFGLQPWKFFVIENPEIRAQLVEHSWGQKQVVDASHLVVLAIRTPIDADYVDHYLARMAEVQGVPVENLQKFGDVVKGFIAKPPYPLDMEDWATRQVYIALAQLMTVAAMVGVDTCPMEGFIPAKYDEVLGLAGLGYKSVVVCPLGYRAADDKYATSPKVRFPVSEVVEYR
ncbi:NAD(P)H-dependent oxidoreductase [Synechococcus sp. PCC 6312]|uniref:NAD(P)H-dependent oxidoreductase n=1 Tax=Synechococcus sp. (strain ATCC 27167 / PCC 6312) TaxID=195253 RepID=UPI00029F0972|nr:NAD(P)H-dependent oxidoreductase [Synechococcus sp. PCC 6312]AFY62757.1 nitroreductase [Synechococcus sp. PCC 6312]